MIVKKRFLGHAETQGLVNNIIRHLQKRQIQPAVIVGITRGGLTPAVMMSHYYKCPLLTLDYSLRDREDADLNDAATQQVLDKLAHMGLKHVLVVDDINDS
jgi:hypoxanthine phosphoribosyltransferase